MTIAQELASFVVRTSYDDLSAAAGTQLKIRVLDSLGCAIEGNKDFMEEIAGSFHIDWSQEGNAFQENLC